MEFFTNDVMGGLLAQSLETAALGADGFHDVGAGPGLDGGRRDRLAHDRRPRAERRRRRHAGSATTRSCPARIPVYGYVYDVRTGSLVEVAAATEAGRAA